MNLVKFAVAIKDCKSIEEAAKVTSLTVNTVRQKMGNCRKAGILLPSFSRNSTKLEPSETEIAELAALYGMTPEQYKEQAAKNKAETVEKGEKIKAAKAAKAAEREAAKAAGETTTETETNSEVTTESNSTPE
jgi:hypothetical protein